MEIAQTMHFMKKRLPILLVLFFLSKFAFAHESRPLYLKITEDSTHLFFELNLPNSVNIQNFPIIYFDTIAINQNVKWLSYTAGFRQKWQLRKSSNLLKGTSVKIEYPVFNPVLSTILAITFEDKSEQILIIPPNENSIKIPKEANAAEVR